jgi:hypothetical protein
MSRYLPTVDRAVPGESARPDTQIRQVDAQLGPIMHGMHGLGDLAVRRYPAAHTKALARP